jgi:quinol monooxygenase YgiN
MKGGRMITLTIEVKSKPEKINELFQTLQALLPTMRQEKACLNCRVSQDFEDGDVYVLSSDWREETNFEGYIKSASGGVLLGAIKTLGQSTRIQLGSDTKWEGVETLIQIRRKS